MDEQIEIARLLDEGCPHDLEVDETQMPTRMLQECPLCYGEGWVGDYDEDVECPLCVDGWM